MGIQSAICWIIQKIKFGKVINLQIIMKYLSLLTLSNLIEKNVFMFSKKLRLGNITIDIK